MEPYCDDNGFRHVLSAAASVESSGVQWSTANYVELALNFNKSRIYKRASKNRPRALPNPSKSQLGTSKMDLEGLQDSTLIAIAL